jgi:hypothetical protein
MAGQSLVESGESPLRTAVAELSAAVLGDTVAAPRRRGRRLRR